MYHQREKYLQLSFIMIGLAIITSVVAILKSYYSLILISLFLIAISLVAEALFLHLFHRKLEALKHIIRALLIVILVFFLFAKIIIQL